MTALALGRVQPNMAGATPSGVGLSTLMDERASFGELVRRFRKMRRMGQEQLAEAAGTDKGTVSEIEGNPDRRPGHDLAQRIITALKAPPEPFLRALGYSLGEIDPDAWKAGLWADDRYTDEAKQMIQRMADLELKAAERNRRAG